jgi:hypothetical protein
MFDTWVLLTLALVLLLAAAAPAAESLDPARVREIVPMLPDRPVGLGRPISDRATWDKLAQLPGCQTLIKRAEGYLTQALPEQPDDLFLDFSRTGNRTHWQAVAFPRRGRLMPLVVAECLENKGRFLPPLEQLIEALCAEKTWVMPAHDGSLKNFRGEVIDIDLASSALGWDLATANWLLGDKLTPAVRDKLHENITRRVLTPFHDMFAGARPANWWMFTTSNWNAVCLAGVAGTAVVAVADKQQRAEFIAAADKYVRNFLAGFTPDGYCSEGLGYWDYGFGNFVLLAETLRQATVGKLDLLMLPQVKAPAMFGANINIMNGVSPAFADCSVDARPDYATMWFVNRRLHLGLSSYDELSPGSGLGGLSQSMLLTFPNGASETSPAPPAAKSLLRTWFKDAGILISRPAPGSQTPMGVALKGGNNAEHHNHNDVGSYVVVVGSRAVLLDPGGEVYTARTFSAHRYDSKLLNSYGHAVPLVAGQMQKEGADAHGVVLKSEFTDDTDTLQFDIKSAYPVPELKTLERTFVYSRAGAGSLKVSDRVEFTSPQAFETALITRGSSRQLAPGKLLILDSDQAVEATIQVTGGDYEIKSDQIREDSAVKPTRLAIALTRLVTSATIEVTFQPGELPGVGAGLLKNGGFEFEKFFWSIPEDGVSELSTEQVCEGKHSLKITDTSTDRGSDVHSGRMPTQAGREYTLSGQVYHVSGQGIGMYVQYFDDQGQRLNPADEHGGIAPVGSLEGPTGKWSPFAYRFKTPPGTTRMSVWIHSFMAAQVVAYLDDLKIESQ